MPASTMHAHFSDKLFESLNHEIRQKIDKDKMATFSQGPDIFLIYHQMFQSLSKKGLEVQKFGNRLHNEKVSDFFSNCARYIMDNDLTENKDIMSCLFGFLAGHYVLDYNMHPYVYYKSGVFDSNNPDTYKYNGRHGALETVMDHYVLEDKLHISPANKYRKTEYGFRDLNVSEEVRAMLNQVCFETYGVIGMGDMYEKALKESVFLTDLTCYDPSSKKFLLEVFFDKIRPTGTKLSTYSGSYPLTLSDSEIANMLNLNNLSWNHPLDSSEIHSDSIDNLFATSLGIGKNMIIGMYNVLVGNDREARTVEITGNNSYDTGKDWTQHKIKDMKHFDPTI